MCPGTYVSHSFVLRPTNNPTIEIEEIRLQHTLFYMSGKYHVRVTLSSAAVFHFTGQKVLAEASFHSSTIDSGLQSSLPFCHRRVHAVLLRSFRYRLSIRRLRSFLVNVFLLHVLSFTHLVHQSCCLFIFRLLHKDMFLV